MSISRFFEWLKFLNYQKNTITIGILNFISEYDNNKKHFEYFEKNYKIYLAPKYTNNNDILKGVDAVLTVFGSVGHKYPYLIYLLSMQAIWEHIKTII